MKFTSSWALQDKNGQVLPEHVLQIRHASKTDSKKAHCTQATGNKHKNKSGHCILRNNHLNFKNYFSYELLLLKIAPYNRPFSPRERSEKSSDRNFYRHF